MKERLAILIAVLIAAAPTAWAVKTLPEDAPPPAAPTNAPSAPVPPPDSRPGAHPAPPDSPLAELELTWHTEIEAALAAAAIDYRPVLVFFTRPDCGWCHRLKAEIQADPDTRSVLRHFVRVLVDASRQEAEAVRYQIRSVPTLVILSSSGTPREVIRGYVPGAELRRSLTQAMNPQYLRSQDAVYLELLSLLQQDSMPTGRWAEVMTQLGRKDRRAELHDRIFARTDIPRPTLVRLLDDPRLSVRIGALEILEEMAGSISDFDPWLSEGARSINAEARVKWADWAAGSTNAVRSLHTALTREQILSHIRELVSGSRDRSLRSIAMLRHAGPGAADVFDEFLAANPTLTPFTRQRLKEVQYALLLPPIQGVDGAILAHRLVYGTLDTRLQSLLALRHTSRRSLRVVREFLQDGDAIVRETAVDVMLAVGGRSAVTTFKKHLQTEKDSNVIHRILRGLGEVRSRQGLGILVSYLDHEDEDMVIAALGSIAKLRTALAIDGIRRCIDDPRWRVRVAAMDAAGALKLTLVKDRVAARLDDPDEFVRFSAIRTLTLMEERAAVDKLEQLFHKEDSLKGPVVEAFSRMRLKMPPSFTRELKKASPDILLSVIDAFSLREGDDLSFLGFLAEHENDDVACSAIRKLAESAMESHDQRLTMIRVLRTAKSARRLAALESIRIPMDTALPPPAIVAQWRRTAASAEGPAPDREPGSSGLVNDLMDAFLGAAGTSNAPATNGVQPGAAAAPAVDDLLSAFLGDSPTDSLPPTPDTPARRPGQSPGDSLSSLLETVESLMLQSDDPSIRHQAALKLVRFGSPDALARLSTNFNSRTISERLQIASAIEPVRDAGSLALFTTMLQDPSDEVRKAAISGCLANARNERFVTAVFDALDRTPPAIQPAEVFSVISGGYAYAFNSERVARRAAGKWARKILAGPATEPFVNLALFILEGAWQPDDAPRIEPFCRAESPYTRRAAGSILGRKAPALFEGMLAAVVADKSHLVRAVIPRAYSLGDSMWIHYLDKDHFSRSSDSDYSGYHGRSSRPPALPETARKVILDLTSDEAPSVRIAAFLCLLKRNEPFDLTRLVATLDTIPDQAFAIEHISRYVMENYSRLGPGFNILVPYLKPQRWDEERYEKVLEHFHMAGDFDADDIVYITATGTPRGVQATFVDVPDAPAPPAEKGPLKLIYFQTAGCASCRKVEEMLAHLPELFPGLQIKQHNIREVRSLRLNEALCERLGVPDNLRLVSPSIFTAAGWLIKGDITESRLSALLARAAWETTPGWDVVAEEALFAADAAIGERSRGMSFAVVAAAGLLDGLNPCAFATIIFFISYLHVARRRPREILSVGAAFVLGVFLAYLGLGIGLAGVVSRLSIVQRFTQALNGLLAAVTLLLMILNLRDGFRCLRGNLGDTTLQLPAFLKDRIHAAIRRGTRQAHFVAAAFVVGVVISFLELACTGQVYAPTILYMLKTGRNVAGSMAFLTAYNLAFVAPLIAIFLLAYRGIRSDTLQAFLHRHAAAVKFATAALFLALFLFFVYAPDIQALFTHPLEP